MNSPKISVIVPVYNVEKYLRRCIDSILAQTFTDFELLLIDDGSTDKSGEICDEYAKKDSRVRVFHKENGGVSSARNLGLDNAQGEWITFVDSDDKLDFYGLETLANNISVNTNIIIGAYYSCYDEKKQLVEIFPGSYKSEEYVDMILLGKVNVAFWAKLYRKKVFYHDTLNLPKDIKNSEDLITNMRIACSQNENVVIVNKAVYNYRVGRPNSATMSYVPSLQYELTIKDYVIECLEKNNILKEHSSSVSYYYFNLLWYWTSKKAYYNKNLTKKELQDLKNLFRLSRVEKKTIKSLIKIIIIRFSLLLKGFLLSKSNFI